MTDNPAAAETRSRKVFAAAPDDVKQLVRRILQDERLVQHQSRRVLPGTGEGIHQALLRHLREAVK